MKPAMLRLLACILILSGCGDDKDSGRDSALLGSWRFESVRIGQGDITNVPEEVNYELANIDSLIETFHENGDLIFIYYGNGDTLLSMQMTWSTDKGKLYTEYQNTEFISDYAVSGDSLKTIEYEKDEDTGIEYWEIWISKKIN